MRETQAQKSARARQIIEALSRAYPQASIALRFTGPFELLVAVILSAQCTDQRVNAVTPGLLARYPTVTELARAEPSELEKLIRPCGLFRGKARALIGASQAIVDQGGAVPTSRQELARLPGVGNKTAGVVSMQLTEEPALPVDTHVARLAFRLGLSAAHVPDQIERELQALLPSRSWKGAHHLLIWHGRQICVARAPRCPVCQVNALCPKRGVRRTATG